MMRWGRGACGIALVVLTASGVQAEGASLGKRRITTEQEYRDEIVGKRAVTKHGYVVPHEDGTMSGKIRGKKLTGKWWWKGEYFCRTFKVGSKSYGQDCQTQFLEGDRLTGRRKMGKGKAFSVRIEGR